MTAKITKKDGTEIRIGGVGGALIGVAFFFLALFMTGVIAAVILIALPLIPILFILEKCGLIKLR